MPRGGAVAGTAVARTVITTLAAVGRLTVIGTLIAIVRLRLLIPLVEVVKQKRERKRNPPADLSLSWTFGGKEQTACCEQNNERFHVSTIMSRAPPEKGNKAAFSSCSGNFHFGSQPNSHNINFFRFRQTCPI
jgi:hypothetical protein